MKKLVGILMLLLLAGTVSAQIIRPVKLSYAARKISGTEAMLYVKVTIDDGWHIYSLNQKAGGPLKTSLSFSGNGFSMTGKITEPKPKRKYEQVFRMDVFYFENSVLFTQKIKLNQKQVSVQGKIEFMVCNAKECLPPDEVGFTVFIK